MENRCDSVDALMYAYYAFMKNKEENQMLEKNKDYLEMRVSSTDCAFTQNGPAQIAVDGFVYTTYLDVPDPGEFYILISKEKFEKLQADNEHYRERAKQWEENHNLLLKKTGFDTVESLVHYLNDIHQLDTLLEVLANYGNKIEALQIENEQLKSKLHEYDPIPDFKELLAKLYSKDDVEKLEWTLNHICGGQASVNGWIATSSFWKQNCEALSKLVGFSSVEEIQDYLTNEAECDTLQEAIASLEYSVKFARDERRDLSKKLEECEKDYISERDKAEVLQTENEQLRNERTHIVYLNDPLGVIAKWEKVTGYDSPKAFLKWKANIEGIMEAWKSGTGCKYPAEARVLLEKWKTLTKCETPEAAATWITSYEKACERGNGLAQDIEAWKKSTGCDTPEMAEGRIKYYHSRLGNAVQAASCAAKHLDNITF